MRICKILSNLIADERGGQVTEYAVVTGLITVAAVGVVGKLGTKIVSRWTAIQKGI